MKKYLAVLVFTLSVLISGCSLVEPEVVYIKTPCPKLQTWEVEPLDENITYEVYDESFYDERG